MEDLIDFCVPLRVEALEEVVGVQLVHVVRLVLLRRNLVLIKHLLHLEQRIFALANFSQDFDAASLAIEVLFKDFRSFTLSLFLFTHLLELVEAFTRSCKVHLPLSLLIQQKLGLRRSDALLAHFIRSILLLFLLNHKIKNFRRSLPINFRIRPKRFDYIIYDFNVLFFRRGKSEIGHNRKDL